MPSTRTFALSRKDAKIGKVANISLCVIVSRLVFCFLSPAPAQILTNLIEKDS